MRKLRKILIYLGIVAQLSVAGCGQVSCFFGLGGNGDGYCGAKPKVAEEPTPTGQNEPAGTIGLDSLGQSYFWVEPGYSCHDSSGALVKSYRAKIVAGRDGSFTRYGDSCTTGPLETLSQNDLEIEMNSGIIGFKEGIYQHDISSYVEVWCPDPTQSTDSNELKVVAPADKPSELVLHLLRAMVLRVIEVVVSKEENGILTYTGPVATLEIDLISDSGVPYKKKAHLKAGTFEMDSLCRVLKH